MICGMNTPIRNLDEIAPAIRHVLHPSDFSDASRVAFVHALKVALITKARLSLIHETSDEQRDWSEFPDVQETLVRWGILPARSATEAVSELGIETAKIIGSGSDPVKGVLDYLKENGADLVVLATRHHGFDWLHRSISEPIARKSGEMTLFVPDDGRGFVSPTDGAVSLRHILIPIAETPSPGPALAGAARLVRRLNCETGNFTLLHVGEKQLKAEPPRVPGWSWRRLLRKGNAVEVIIETAREKEADLIVMTTDGRNGFLDALRGSHSERVLRHAPCPLLAIPESSHAVARLAAEDWYQQRASRTRRTLPRPT